MGNYIFTGISGSGRLELLEELKIEINKREKTINVYDVGRFFLKSARDLNINVTDQKVLDMDDKLLFSLRKNAINDIQLHMHRSKVDYNFIGIHATFRWKNRLIKGLAYRDLLELKNDFSLDGFVNIVDDVKSIVRSNSKNPKWKDVDFLDDEETNQWLIEEEFVTETLADFLNLPMYLVGRKHNINNLADLFLTDKDKFYLSYPITNIEKDSPELLIKIRKEILPKFEEKFIIFDP